jgi:hypothetical protein
MVSFMKARPLRVSSAYSGWLYRALTLISDPVVFIELCNNIGILGGMQNENKGRCIPACVEIYACSIDLYEVGGAVLQRQDSFIFTVGAPLIYHFVVHDAGRVANGDGELFRNEGGEIKSLPVASA